MRHFIRDVLMGTLIIAVFFELLTTALSWLLPSKYLFLGEKRGIPVLMYHSVGIEQGNPLILSTEKFEEQMKYLKDNDYNTLTMDEMYNFIVNNKQVPDKSVVITFDDGYRDVYKNAYPILKKYRLNATVFVITSMVEKGGYYLNLSELKEMQNNGIDIESHTVNHDKLDKLTFQEQYGTMLISRIFLEQYLNKKVRYIAYPFGKYNGNTFKAAEAAGYKMAFTTRERWASSRENIYKLSRVFIDSFDSINIFKIKISNPYYLFF